MQHELKPEFMAIAKEIVSSQKTETQWALVESDDMFRKGDYAGGFDATEMEFVFGYTENGKEFVFQLTLEQISKVNSGEIKSVSAKGL